MSTSLRSIFVAGLLTLIGAIAWGSVTIGSAAADEGRPMIATTTAQPGSVQFAVNDATTAQSVKTTLVVDNWRYRWYGGRWWYWRPTNRWAYWNGGVWNDYVAPGTVVYGYNSVPNYDYYAGPRYYSYYRPYPYYGPRYYGYRPYYGPRARVWVGY